MRKYISYLITAFAITLFAVTSVSCQKDGPDKTYDEPTYTSHAQIINLPENPLGISRIELTEAGRFIVTFSPEKVKSPAEDNVLFRTGKFTYTNGVYNLEGYGTLTIKDSEITLNVKDEDSFTAVVAITYPGKLDELEQKLCRTWKVDKTKIAFHLGEESDLSIECSFDGCDLYEIAKFAADNYLSFLDGEIEDVKGYKVESLTLTGLGSVAIEFTDKEPFVGEWSHKDLDMAYKFAKDYQILNSETKGKIEFVEDHLLLSIYATAEYFGTKYTTEIQFLLSEKK